MTDLIGGTPLTVLAVPRRDHFAMGPFNFGKWRGAAVVLLAILAGHHPHAQQAVIRSGITLIPLDVRVLDDDGEPVRGLMPEDFTVLENGEPQRIVHFSYETITEAPSDAKGSNLPLRQAAGLESSPATRRVFLLFVGRGRVQDVSKAFDGLLEFVRERVVPLDLVAVAAFNRATEFTTDHASIIRLLEQLRDRHPGIEAAMRQHFSVAQILYGSPEIPQHIQRVIDETFSLPGLPAPRQVLPVVPSGSGIEENVRRIREDADRTTPDGPNVGAAKEAYDDLLNLFAAIEYLKHVEGEKHIVHLTEQGMVGLRAADEANGLGAIAADARVAIHTIQAGGVPLRFDGQGVLRSRSFGQLWAYNDGRAVSQQTGGLASFYMLASDALVRIDRATRGRYVLAYSPGAQWDGRYRRIEVKVRRSGVSVLHRRGYFARRQVVPYDRRAFLTSSRIGLAAAALDLVKEIPIELRSSIEGRENRRVQVVVEITIPRNALQYAARVGQYSADLVVASFLADRQRRPIADVRKTVNVKFSTLEGETSGDRRIEVVLRHEAPVDPAYVKVVVYQYDADRLGSALARVR